MSSDSFNFELILNREFNEHELDLLFEAGFDDVLFGVSNNIPMASVERAGKTLADVVIDTIEKLQKTIPSIEVIEVVNPEIVSLPMVAELTGRTKQSIYMLAAGKRGPGNWPKPADSKNGLWRFEDIADWWQNYESNGPIDFERVQVLTAINAHLKEKRALSHLPRSVSKKIEALAA